MATTETGKYRFTVKEGQGSAAGAKDAPVWLELEPGESHLRVLSGGSLSLRLAAGTPYAQAQELARTMNKLVSGVSFTRD